MLKTSLVRASGFAKPTGALVLNRAHDLARYLGFGVVFQANGPATELTGNKLRAWGANSAFANGARGIGLSGKGNGSYVTVDMNRIPSSVAQWAVFAAFRTPSSFASENGFCSGRGGTFSNTWMNWIIANGANAGKLRIESTGTGQVYSTTALAVNTDYTAMWSLDNASPASTLYCYINGIQDNTATKLHTLTPSFDISVGQHDSDASGAYFRGVLYAFYFIANYWPNAEDALRLHQDPFGLALRIGGRRIVEQAAAGGTTVARLVNSGLLHGGTLTNGGRLVRQAA